MEIKLAGSEHIHSLTASFKSGCSPKKLLEQNSSAVGGVGLKVKT